MCLAYVEYYPRVPGAFSFCASLPDPKESLGILGAEKVDGDSRVILDSNGQNVSIKDWVTRNVDWGSNDAQQRFGMAHKFQETVRDGKHWVLCLSKKTEEEMNAVEAIDEVRLKSHVYSPVSCTVEHR